MLRFARFAVIGLAALLSLPQSPLEAQSAATSITAAQVNADFPSYVQLLIAKARAAGISEPTITAYTADLTPNPRVIALDRAQPGTPSSTGFPPLAPYLASHNTSNRIAQGKAVFQSVAGVTSQIERQYGVPAQILIAIWGHETNYGGYAGDFDLARSLATLAWEGRRRDLFETEFVDLLKIADGGVSRSVLKGSWAGAFGNPQFLPSVYLRLAVDGDGDGRKDIWSSRIDTLYSIANYFRDAGWRPGEPWGVRASLPAGFDPDKYPGKIIAPVCPRVHVRHSSWKTIAEWRKLGVQPLGGIRDDVMASLFQPDGPGTPAWLLTGNYRVILEYNCSNYYAMSVGLLADAIAQ